MCLFKNRKILITFKSFLAIILLVSVFPYTVNAAPTSPKKNIVNTENTRVTLSYPVTRVVQYPLNAPIPMTKWWTEYSGNVLMQGTLKLHSWSYEASYCRAIYTGWLYGAAS